MHPSEVDKSEIDVCTLHTLQFVMSHAKPGQSLLEVGCGSGELAHQLEKSGLVVTAFDKDPEAGFRAAAEGITVHQADFFEYDAESNSFDVILFSRVFHHLHPLDKAVEKISSLLKPGGLIILDEFGAELMDEASALWFFGLKSILAQTEAYDWHKAELEYKDKFFESDVLQIWKEIHFGKHHVIDAATMKSELCKSFTLESEQFVPYLYRYFANRRFRLPDELVPEIYKWEIRSVELQKVKPIGIRWTFQKTN